MLGVTVRGPGTSGWICESDLPHDKIEKLYARIHGEVPPDQEQACDPEPQLDDAMGHYFGNCPLCGAWGCYLNIGSSHVFYCEEHKIGWHVGSNLLSSWREQTEKDWERNKEKLADFKKIDFKDACTAEQRKARDEYRQRHDEWLQRRNQWRRQHTVPLRDYIASDLDLPF
jgi:hypothetical protein